jgi:hypothetical protein
VRLRTLTYTLDTLRQLAEQKAPGPPASFTELHLAKAIEVIGRERIGRLGLSERLRLGEGATRTLIDRLAEAGFVKISRLGCELTRSGLLILHELNKKLGSRTKVSKSHITVGSHNFGILVKGAGKKVKSGIEQRDAAVRAGAAGAVTLVLKQGELVMPPQPGSIVRRWPSVAKQILGTFQPEEYDVIIIAGGDSEKKAEDGASAAAWTLIE